MIPLKQIVNNINYAPNVRTDMGKGEIRQNALKLENQSEFWAGRQLASRHKGRNVENEVLLSSSLSTLKVQKETFRYFQSFSQFFMARGL